MLNFVFSEVDIAEETRIAEKLRSQDGNYVITGVQEIMKENTYEIKEMVYKEIENVKTHVVTELNMEISAIKTAVADNKDSICEMQGKLDKLESLLSTISDKLDIKDWQ